MYGGYSRGAGMSGITSQPLTIAAFGNLFNSLCFSFLIYRKERITGSTSKVLKTKCIDKHKVL